MVLPDVNVLVYAHREDTPLHGTCKAWLDAVLRSPQAFGLSDMVLSGFLRVVTHPRIFTVPTPIEQARGFVIAVRGAANCVVTSPGARHWDIFLGLCAAADTRGNLVPDAYLAALAVESGSDWITTDRDFSRFPGLRWRHPQGA
ncbi:MAG: type II toxin-antitoxin system VapC family toxin [Candidatus Dormibacteraeota bacterium]|nr:type II toxin-antitoxin system VapC family toxin [Candidatus Dormibacteraeota bacterium]